MSRYTTEIGGNGRTTLNVFKIVRDALIALVVTGLLIAYWPLQSVPTGSRGVVTQFGKITGIEPEGLVVLWPIEEMALFNIRAEAADIENAAGATKDTQPVTVSLTVRYSIFPDKVAEVYEKYSHDGDLSSYIQTATQEVFKAVTAKYTAPELITKRALVSQDINATLKRKVAQYGAQVINIDMRNFSFSDDYNKAIAAKVTQEQLLLGAEKKYLTVQAQQKQKVAIATAEAEAVRATADGNAYATIKNAQATADALKLQATALATYGVGVLELRRIEVDMRKASRWNGALPSSIYAGAPIPFMNVDKQ
jgi:prohibitin 2